MYTKELTKTNHINDVIAIFETNLFSDDKI